MVLISPTSMLFSKTFILDSAFADKSENKKIIEKSWKYFCNNFTT